jgi:uncharacterized protein
MARIILLALGLLLVYWLLKGYRRRVDRAGPKSPPVVEGEAMVQCAQCGVHLPRSESIITQGNFYCSAEHQRLHQAERRS